MPLEDSAAGTSASWQVIRVPASAQLSGRSMIFNGIGTSITKTAFVPATGLTLRHSTVIALGSPGSMVRALNRTCRFGPAIQSMGVTATLLLVSGSGGSLVTLAVSVTVSDRPDARTTQ